jgi:hypothetical protein
MTEQIVAAIEDQNPITLAVSFWTLSILLIVISSLSSIYEVQFVCCVYCISACIHPSLRCLLVFY